MTTTDDAIPTETAHEGDVLDATPEGSDSDPDDAGLSRRDIKYRERLRETEAERDVLLQRVERMQRGEIQRLTADRLADPEDLWRETELADLLDDNGNIDATKVDDRTNALLEAHPHWSAPKPKTANASGLKSGASAPAPPRKDSWVTAFSPNRDGIRRD